VLERCCLPWLVDQLYHLVKMPLSDFTVAITSLHQLTLEVSSKAHSPQTRRLSAVQNGVHSFQKACSELSAQLAGLKECSLSKAARHGMGKGNASWSYIETTLLDTLTALMLNPKTLNERLHSFQDDAEAGMTTVVKDAYKLNLFLKGLTEQHIKPEIKILAQLKIVFKTYVNTHLELDSY
jgi:hypothetical protein